MGVINRCAAVVRPREPYRDWMASTSDAELANSAYHEQRADPHVYLLPDEDDGRDALEGSWQLILEAELMAWYTDPAAWPKRMDLTTFLEWFEVETCSMVENLAAGPIVDPDLFD